MKNNRLTIKLLAISTLLALLIALSGCENKAAIEQQMKDDIASEIKLLKKFKADHFKEHDKIQAEIKAFHDECDPIKNIYRFRKDTPEQAACSDKIRTAEHNAGMFHYNYRNEFEGKDRAIRYLEERLEDFQSKM